jgi:uncharacterized Zn-binding protein involved in type VI secretion
MPAQARVSDIGECPGDSHGCPGCSHPVMGPVIGGSPDVMVNSLPAARVGDPGKHASCCGPNTYECKVGSSTVFINGQKAHRKGDDTKHCGGMGQMTMGSPDVFTGG